MNRIYFFIAISVIISRKNKFSENAFSWNKVRKFPPVSQCGLHKLRIRFVAHSRDAHRWIHATQDRGRKNRTASSSWCSSAPQAPAAVQRAPLCALSMRVYTYTIKTLCLCILSRSFCLFTFFFGKIMTLIAQVG